MKKNQIATFGLSSLTLTLTLGLFLAKSSPAEAACRWVWQGVRSRYKCDPEVVDRRSYPFVIINKSNRTVYYSTARFVSEDTGGGSGSYSGISVYTPPHWSVTGWYSVAPGRSITVARRTSKVVLRMEQNGREIKPSKSYPSRYFCLHPTQKFSSKKYVPGRFNRSKKTTISTNHQISSKEGCGHLGTKTRRFYEFPGYFKFTVN